MLKNYFSKIMGDDFTIEMGDDSIGLICKKNNTWYIVNTKFCIIKSSEDNVFADFDDWK